eukprot:scaffold76166_cov69-Phaeocystis_antarctica.AAC.7
MRTSTLGRRAAATRRRRGGRAAEGPTWDCGRLARAEPVEPRAEHAAGDYSRQSDSVERQHHLKPVSAISRVLMRHVPPGPTR